MPVILSSERSSIFLISLMPFSKLNLNLETSSSIILLLVISSKLLVFVAILLINLLKIYPCILFEGTTPALIKASEALRWSAIILKFFFSCSYFLPVTFSNFSIIGRKISVLNMSGSLFNAAVILSNPPPKSTFFCGNSSSSPFSFFLYWIKTEFPISKNLPQSQFG